MTDTPNLDLPVIDVLAQKHLIANDAFAMLDALVMLAVLDRDLTAPPGSPSDGDRYLVKATGTGLFAGHDNQIAHFTGGDWSFYPPRTGWTCFIADEAALLTWNGTTWVDFATMIDLENLPKLGVGTTADTTNVFSAKLNNALWVAKTVGEGGSGDLRYKLSKAGASNTLSFLFQDNYSGRAEVGLTGDDDFHFKVSPDGTTWTSGLVIAASTANAAFGSTTDATSTSAAAAMFAGGVGIAKKLFAGDAVSVTSASASALAVGLNGGSNPALQIDASTASSATGLKIKSAASAAGVALSVISSGTNESLAIDAKGSGTVTIGATSTGVINLNRNVVGAGTISAATGGGNGFKIGSNTVLDSDGTYVHVYSQGGSACLFLAAATNFHLNTTHTFQSQNGAVTFGSFTSSGLAITPSTPSTSSTTGALTTPGGLGIAGALFGGSTIQANHNRIASQATASVTTNQTIYSTTAGGDGALLFVYGDNGSHGFMDLVMFANGTVVVVNSGTWYGTPGARTYTASGLNLGCAIGGGQTMNVRAAAIHYVN